MTWPPFALFSKQTRMDLLETWRINMVLPHITGRLLDIGCGFNHVVQAYGTGVGVDVFPWPGINVLIGNAATLPFGDATFDTVTIVAALNHIPNRAAALQQVHRVLRPNGRLIITMIGPATGIIAHILFVRDERTRGGMHTDEKIGMTRQEIAQLCTANGFKIIHQVPFQLGLNNVFVALKI